MAITVEVKIAGTSPVMMHRFAEEAEQAETTRAMLVNKGTPREQAEKVVYRNGNGFYFPSSWVSTAIIEAGGNHKMRGSRKSLKYLVPAAVRVMEVDVPLLNGDGKSKVSDFEVDSRPVTIPATKGRIMRHRPRFDVWSATFHLVINDTLMEETTVQRLLTEAGEQQGIGDYRPNKRGPFGCFRIISWKKT